jgi:hypothetical protein
LRSRIDDIDAFDVGNDGLRVTSSANELLLESHDMSA